jgi:hypothetical protein
VLLSLIQTALTLTWSPENYHLRQRYQQPEREECGCCGSRYQGIVDPEIKQQP